MTVTPMHHSRTPWQCSCIMRSKCNQMQFASNQQMLIKLAGLQPHTARSMVPQVLKQYFSEIV